VGLSKKWTIDNFGTRRLPLHGGGEIIVENIVRIRSHPEAETWVWGSTNAAYSFFSERDFKKHWSAQRDAEKAIRALGGIEL